MRLALPPHRNFILPYRFCFRWHEVRYLSRDVPRADTIRPCKLHPLNRESLAQVPYGRLGRIVGRLHLRDIHNMPTHTARRNETPIREALEFILFLFTPDLGCGARTVEDAVDVDLHDFAVVRELAVDHGALCPGDAGVGDEDIEAVVELFGLRCYGFFDRGGVGDIHFVCLACAVLASDQGGIEWVLTPDSEFFLYLLGSCQGLFVAVVPDDHVCSGFSVCAGDG